MRQPEVVFDAPRRLEPGHDLPVVLIVNDLERFPAVLSECAVAISQEQCGTRRFDFKELEKYEHNHPLQANMRAFVLPVPREEIPTGGIHINACVTISCPGGKRYTILNDNLRTSTKRPFSCTIAGSQLPGIEYCTYGDLHIHSNYSQSHVEFGPPLSVIDAVAHASGLSCVAITDHSYDLACSTRDYLAADPAQTKWRLYQEEIAKRCNFKTLLIPGEEISCLNEKKEVVHLCGIAINNYLPGTLDGARKGRRKQQQLSLNDAVYQTHQQGGTAFAAHPGARPGFLSRMLLHRGTWSDVDLAASGIDAMQILNSGFSKSWLNGKAMWTSLLLGGKKMPLLAGNDAHGDFNRYRAIKVPFIAISDSPCRYMGFGKTGIYGNHTSIEEIIGAIKNGRTFVTTGPFAGISSSPTPADSIVSNQPVSRDTAAVFINAISSQESHPLHSITCFAGIAGNPVEKIVFSKTFSDGPFAAFEKIDVTGLPFTPLYLRAEVTCAAADPLSVPARAFTSPVYFQNRID